MRINFDRKNISKYSKIFLVIGCFVLLIGLSYFTIRMIDSRGNQFMNGNQGDTSATLVGLTLHHGGDTISVGGTTTIRVRATYTDGSVTDVTDDVSWSTSNSKIATIENGVVTGIGGGSATITARYEGKSDSVVIEVEGEVVKYLTGVIVSSNGGTTLRVGGASVSLSVEAVFSDDSSAIVTSNVSSWSSSDNTIATVSNGIVTPVSAGVATITASYAYEGTIRYGELVITVIYSSEPVLNITGPQTSMAVGQKMTLTATMTPATGSQTIVWRSMDTSIATVDSSGVVTAISEGTVKITAAIQGSSIQGTYEIVVYEEEEDTTTKSIVITGGPAVAQGQTITLKASVVPLPAVQTVTWKSSDTTIATVDENGVVTGLESGTVTITATSSEYNVYASLEVKVVSNKVLISGPRSVLVNETITLRATSPSSDEITWSSLDESIATVDSNGVVTGKKAGSVDIKATNGNGAYELARIQVIDFGSISVNHEELYLAKSDDTENITVTIKDSSGNALEGMELYIDGIPNYVNVTIKDYVLTTTSNGNGGGSGTGTVSETIKVCTDVGDTKKCADYNVNIYCQKWTLVGSEKTFYLGYSLGEAHLTDTCYYRDISFNSCQPVYNQDNVLSAYRCTTYYNRCCGTSSSDSPVCYVNSTTGDYKWTTTSPGSGYIIDTTKTTESSCKAPVVTPTYSCYVNSTTGDYKWATTSPGEGYVIDSSKTTESSCKAPVVTPTYSCYVNSTTGDYKWATTSPGEGYAIDSSKTTESSCKAPIVEETPACYKDKDDKYVWGKYQNDNNYTLIEDILNEDDCKETIDVPITSRDVMNIIYVFVIILLASGIYVIYYSYMKKKNNK